MYSEPSHTLANHNLCDTVYFSSADTVVEWAPDFVESWGSLINKGEELALTKKLALGKVWSLNTSFHNNHQIMKLPLPFPLFTQSFPVFLKGDLFCWSVHEGEQASSGATAYCPAAGGAFWAGQGPSLGAAVWDSWTVPSPPLQAFAGSQMEQSCRCCKGWHFVFLY